MVFKILIFGNGGNYLLREFLCAKENSGFKKTKPQSLKKFFHSIPPFIDTVSFFSFNPVFSRDWAAQEQGISTRQRSRYRGRHPPQLFGGLIR